jgi:hypothetical protein
MKNYKGGDAEEAIGVRGGSNRGRSNPKISERRKL